MGGRTSGIKRRRTHEENDISIGRRMFEEGGKCTVREWKES